MARQDNNPHEHPFAQYVRILGKGKKGSRSLTEEEAFDAMSMIMAMEVEDVQLGAFLMLMRVKEESPDELLGFAKAVRGQFPQTTIKADLDWSCYAGKRRHLPWYLLSVFILAGNNHSIFMHGASGHTIERIYTEDILRELGLPIAENWEQAEQQLQTNNFCYFPLQFLSPELHRIIELRNTLGLRSPVHTLSRLLNPTSASAVIQGIFHPGYQPVHQEAGAKLGYERISVIKGDGGEIEVNPDNDTLVSQAVNGELSETIFPALFDKRHVKPKALDTQHLISVWKGEENDDYGEGAVLSTTAVALFTLGVTATVEASRELAKQYWQNRDKAFLS